MKKNLTEIVFILDKSGSMAGLEADTVGGFNAMIEKQRKEEGEAYVTTVLFSNDFEIVHDRVKLGDVSSMSVDDYSVSGCTALMDALGEMIVHISNIHKYARPEDVPEHTVFVITTDGMENASHKYNSDTVKAMVKEKDEEQGWDFIYLAANIDAVESGKTIGIRKERVRQWSADRQGVNDLYAMACCDISRIRKSSSDNNRNGR